MSLIRLYVDAHHQEGCALKYLFFIELFIFFLLQDLDGKRCISHYFVVVLSQNLFHSPSTMYDAN